MIFNRRLYVCNLCNRAYHHPLRNCTRCPGTMVPRDVPYDEALYPQFTTENYRKWLEANGLKDLEQ